MKKILFIVALLGSFLVANPKVLYSLDFSKEKDGDATAWLSSRGFEFLLDSKALNLHFSKGRLTFETTDNIAGLFGIRFKNGIPNVGSVIIEWGVDRFPKGADWSKDNNRLAIGAIFLMGTKRFSSGVPLVKSVPYFLAPFIGKKESIGKQYTGKLYKKSGKYYCTSNKSGLKKTHFNIDKKFKESFGIKVPPLTAFAFQMNTKNTNGGAKAFIKKITFYSK